VTLSLTRRALVTGTAAIAVALGMGAATTLPAFAQDDDTIKLALSARGLRTIDPARSIQGADEWAIIHIFDTLAEIPAGRFPQTVDEVQPSLAKSWTSNEEATVWTFELRDDVEFQKGYGPLTSEDVKYSFDRLLDPDELGVRTSLYQNLESVETDGPHRVIMTLKQPDPLWVMGPLLHY
jgi:peptide/nickel transport system substrate-binding protein